MKLFHLARDRSSLGESLLAIAARRNKQRRALNVVFVLLAIFSASAHADIVDDLQPGHWAAVSLNTMADVNPCPGDNCSYSALEGQAAITDNWNGGAYATGFSNRGGLVLFGGGHGAYYGNEIYVFNLDTLRWVRVSEPVENPVCNYSVGELQDGSPCSAHTYDYVQYHPATNSFIELGSASNHDRGGGGAPMVHLFSFDTGTWRRGSGSNFPNFISMTGASSAYDPNRDVFWVLPAYSSRFMQYDPNANNGGGQWTPHSVFDIDIDAMSAIDPVRDIFVTLDSRGTQSVIVHDLKNPSARGVFVTTIGDKALESAQKPGFEWDPVVEKFVSWGGGAAVYTLTPPTGDWATGTWVWERIDPAPGNSVVPTSPNENGTYSRFRYAPAVNAYVVLNRTNESVYMYRLSDGTGSVDTPTLTFSADPASVTAGSSAMLNWTSTNVDSCTASGDWSGSQVTNGSQNTGPLQQPATYSLSCSGANGTVTRTVDVQVTSSIPGGDADADWQERSSGPGVVNAIRFDSAADVANGVLIDGLQDRVSWTNEIKTSGSGALRFDVLNSDAANSGNWRWYLKPDQSSFGAGDEFYVQYRYYSTEDMWRYKPDHGSGTGGYKLSIVSHWSSSNQANEIVTQNTNYRGFPQLYWQDGRAFVDAQEVRNTPCNSGNFVFQNAIDRGTPSNPSTCAEYAQRYGPLYDYGSGSDFPSAGDITNQGGGHPNADAAMAGVAMPTNDWMTILTRIRVGTFGTSSSEIDVWIARNGEDYVKTQEYRNVLLGAGPDFNALWLLPYDTGKQPNTKGRSSFVVYDEVIVSTETIAAPGFPASPPNVWTPQPPTNLVAE